MRRILAAEMAVEDEGSEADDFRPQEGETPDTRAWRQLRLLDDSVTRLLSLEARLAGALVDEIESFNRPSDGSLFARAIDGPDRPTPRLEGVLVSDGEQQTDLTDIQRVFRINRFLGLWKQRLDQLQQEIPG